MLCEDVGNELERKLRTVLVTNSMLVDNIKHTVSIYHS